MEKNTFNVPEQTLLSLFNMEGKIEAIADAVCQLVAAQIGRDTDYVRNLFNEKASRYSKDLHKIYSDMQQGDQ